MSGELDTRPDLVEQIRELRDRLHEVERRVAGDEQGFDLSDLNDVRVDSIGDAGITLVDGSALVFRAADDIWVPGSTGGLPITADDGTNTASIALTAHDLILSNTLDAGSVLKSSLNLGNDGLVEVKANGGVLFNVNGATSPGAGGGFYVNDPVSGGTYGGGIFLNSKYAIDLTTNSGTSYLQCLASGGGSTNLHGSGQVNIGAGSGSLSIGGGNGDITIAGNANTLGFFSTTPVAQPTVTGSRGGNAALTSLLAALGNLGLVIDSST